MHTRPLWKAHIPRSSGPLTKQNGTVYWMRPLHISSISASPTQGPVPGQPQTVPHHLCHVPGALVRWHPGLPLHLMVISLSSRLLTVGGRGFQIWSHPVSYKETLRLGQQEGLFSLTGFRIWLTQTSFWQIVIGLLRHARCRPEHWAKHSTWLCSWWPCCRCL